MTVDCGTDRLCFTAARLPVLVDPRWPTRDRTATRSPEADECRPYSRLRVDARVATDRGDAPAMDDVQARRRTRGTRCFHGAMRKSRGLKACVLAFVRSDSAVDAGESVVT